MISCLYPPEGITIGSITIRFPSIESVLVGNKQPEPEPELKVKQDSLQLQHLENLKDTLREYKIALTEQQGHIYLPDDDVTFFDDMFAKMQHARKNKQIVRILHYGDSQIEMDRLSANLRTFFQSEFGGGGPGLLPAVQTIPSAAVSQYADGNFTLYTSYGDGKRANGNYGLMARCYRLAGNGIFSARASTRRDVDERVKHFSTVTLLYNNRESIFQATLTDRHGTCRQDTAVADRGIHTCHWHLDSATSSLQIAMQGSADIYGIMLDDGYGVSVDNIPMRGSSGTQFTLIRDTLLRTCYRQINTGLIILQFGGNSVPIVTTPKSLRTYCDHIAREIQYLTRCCPQAPILFIGPSDMSTRCDGLMKTYPMLPQLTDSLRATVLRNHAAYWDLFDVMGGENSMIAWVQHGLAGPDYIHFTPAGANRVGNALVKNFAELYEFYCTRKDIDPEQFHELWDDAAL